ncbi:hypothetical protein BpHYR1_006887 [Brachionus plicatilis]|uniref:Uncharacterized protein n=1 Tax=Brachionus plicatilis TaxID=10195 RepID=A0A3M7T931_BRAPC|nr:hypothetical protein BpHYR1_006887 [Brachionus plicatilis]
MNALFTSCAQFSPFIFTYFSGFKVLLGLILQTKVFGSCRLGELWFIIIWNNSKKQNKKNLIKNLKLRGRQRFKESAFGYFGLLKRQLDKSKCYF